MKNVCKKCSPSKVEYGSECKRICDKCLQIRIQDEVFKEGAEDLQGIIREVERRNKERVELDCEVRRMNEELGGINEHVQELREFKNKEIDVVVQKKNKLEDSLRVLEESLKQIKISEIKMQERLEARVAEIEKYNKILIELNEQRAFLDDRIYETKEFLLSTMHENDVLTAVANEGFTEFNIKGKKLNEKILKSHRRTLNNIESMNYDSAFISVEIKNLQSQISEKRLELLHKKDLYENSHLYLIPPND